MKPRPLLLLVLSCAFLSCATASAYHLYGASEVAGADIITILDTLDINALPSDVKSRLHLPAVLPSEGAKLNYTQIMFEHPQVAGAEQYVIEIAADDGSNSFNHPLFTQTDSSTAILFSNFEFGKKYIWRYAGLHQNTGLGWQGPYYFEILDNPCVDKNQYRVRVLQNNRVANSGGLMMLDMARCIDRNGNFVWFLPNQSTDPVSPTGFFTTPMAIEDLRLTPFGTVALLNNGSAEERDLTGKLLWQAPVPANQQNALKPNGYHHCFKRLSNGNYMVLDQKAIANPALPGQNAVLAYEIIKEFNPAGNLVWSWSSQNYFNDDELRAMEVDKPDPFLNNRTAGGHMNSFDVDEKNGFVYVGFRNVSRVIKIDKKTGKVLCAWGENMSRHHAPNGNGFFLKQHGSALLHDGSIAVFNNNVKPANTISGNTTASGVVIFSQPTDTANSRIIFEYDCAFDSSQNYSNTGGNVEELGTGNLLVCMGEVNRVFEITRNKKIVWNALIEKHQDFDSSWSKFPVYRAHYTSSLYPCYFTVQTTGTGIKIFNDGTETDAYQVSVSSTTGNNKKTTATGPITAKKSVDINLPGIHGATVTVTSKTNPGFKRVVSIK